MKPSSKQIHLMQAAAFLREETRQLHRETESVALGREIMDHSLTIEQYRRLIARNYFLHRVLEPLLQNGLKRFERSEFTAFLHPKLEALRADAELLHLTLPEYPVASPQLNSASRTLGGLYVLLGSNLGSRLIYRALKENPRLDNFTDFHFYRSSGVPPAKEWPQFCRLLDQYLESASDLEEAKTGAEAVFRFVRDVHAIRM